MASFVSSNRWSRSVRVPEVEHEHEHELVVPLPLLLVFGVFGGLAVLAIVTVGGSGR